MSDYFTNNVILCLKKKGHYIAPVDESKKLYTMAYQSPKYHRYAVFINMNSEACIVSIFGVFPAIITVERLPQIIAYANYVNCRTLIGNIEININEPTVEAYFNVGLSFSNLHISQELINNLLSACVQSLDLYGPGLVAVLNGENDLSKAYKLEKYHFN